MVEPLPPRLPPREKKEKPPKQKKAKTTKRDKTADNGQAHTNDSTPETTDEVEGSGIVFMDPVLLNEDNSAREVGVKQCSRMATI